MVYNYYCYSFVEREIDVRVNYDYEQIFYLIDNKENYNLDSTKLISFSKSLSNINKNYKKDNDSNLKKKKEDLKYKISEEYNYKCNSKIHCSNNGVCKIRIENPKLKCDCFKNWKGRTCKWQETHLTNIKKYKN